MTVATEKAHFWFVDGQEVHMPTPGGGWVCEVGDDHVAGRIVEMHNAAIREAEAAMKERAAKVAESHCEPGKDIHTHGWDGCCADEQGPKIAAAIRALE